MVIVSPDLTNVLKLKVPFAAAVVVWAPAPFTASFMAGWDVNVVDSSLSKTVPEIVMLELEGIIGIEVSVTKLAILLNADVWLKLSIPKTLQ